jgi:RNA polymerase sigma-70 factor, ECF subfamily
MRPNRVLEISPRRSEISDEEATIYGHWIDLVERIRAYQIEGMEELYRFFSTGLRFFLWRQTGPQDLDDRFHDLFILIVHAIQRGDIREPERLMGFVRTVAQRQVAARVRQVVNSRKEEIGIESGREFKAPDTGPEQAAICRQREELARRGLAELHHRDREVLIRFYVKEQNSGQICLEMKLSETQFRLLKSRAKIRFGNLGKKMLRPNTFRISPPVAGHPN